MPDNTWCFMDVRGKRQGPVADADVTSAYRRGDLLRDGLVWREGMPQWLVLRQVEDELGLDPSDPAAAPPAPPATAPYMAATTSTRSFDRTEIVYAGFARRFAALFVDGLILAIPSFLLSFVLGIAFAILMQGSDSHTMFIAQTAFGTILGLILRAAYFSVMESSKGQGTIGKRAFGIKVTNEAGGRLTFMQALGRWFAAGLSYLTLYVGFFMAGFTDRKRALHDMVAGTLVVDRWAYTEFPERQQRDQSGVLMAVIIVFFFMMIVVVAILAAIAIPAYQDFTIRSQVAEGSMLAEGSKIAVADYYARNHDFPRNNAAAGVAGPSAMSGNFVSSVTINNGVITVAYGGPKANAMLPSSATLVFAPRGDGEIVRWACNSVAGSTVEAKYRPTLCRP
jgi:uncharacterized RDD family membrane protein YckC/Tfp pilus assembly protein PilE